MPNSLDSFDPFAPQAKSLDDFDPFAQPAAPTQATPATPAIARPSSTIRRVVGDTAVDLGKGLLGVGEAVVGAGNIVSGGYVGKGLEAIGYDPVTSKKMLEEGYTPERVAANKEVADAKGFMPTIAAAIKNPSTIAGAVVESAPLMLGGAGLARGGATLLGKAGSIARPGLMGQLAAIPQTVAGRIGLAAAGEGLVGAGSAAESIRQQSDDGLLDAKGTVASLASGAGTAILGALGGKAAQKLGIADVDVALAGGSTLAGPKKNILRRAAQGVLAEGVFEELPQSAQEQMWQNYATGKPIMDGVAEAAAMGALAGGVMGGGFSAIAGNPKDATTDKTTSTETPSGVGRPLSGSIDVSNAPSLDDAPTAKPDPADPINFGNVQGGVTSTEDMGAELDAAMATPSTANLSAPATNRVQQAADNLRAEAQVMDAQAQTGIGKAAAMATAMQADAIEQSNPFGYQPPTFGYEAPTFPPAPNDGRTRLAQQAKAQGIDPRIVLTLDDAEAGELDQYDDKLLATYAKGLWSDLQSGRRTLPGYNPQEDGRGSRQDTSRPVQEQSGLAAMRLPGDAVPDASSGGDAAGAVAAEGSGGAASLAGQAPVQGAAAGAQAEGVIDALSAERRSRLVDGLQPNTGLDNALNAILIGGIDEQALMDAVRYGAENGRPEIAAAAAAELRKSANSAAKQKPGVPEGSPKYAAIAADLARRAQEAAKLADEAEAMATQPAGADEAAGAQAQGLTRDNPLPESEIERAPVGAWVAGPSIPGVADADTVRQVQDVPIDQIDATEFTSDGKLVADKRADASRYAESMRNGDQFPNARGSVLPNGKIKLQDGHRRLAAAIENGATTLRIAVMPPAQGLTPARAPLSVRMGGNEYPVESYEDASAKFRQLRDTVDIGGMPAVELIDQGGNPVGYIGQGGEVYEGSFQEARLSPERKSPVYRPPAGEALADPNVIEGKATRVTAGQAPQEAQPSASSGRIEAPQSVPATSQPELPSSATVDAAPPTAPDSSPLPAEAAAQNQPKTTASEVSVPSPQGTPVEGGGQAIQEAIDSDPVLASNRDRAVRAATMDEGAFVAAEVADAVTKAAQAGAEAKAANELRIDYDARLKTHVAATRKFRLKNASLRKNTPEALVAAESALREEGRNLRRREEMAAFDLQQAKGVTESSMRAMYGRLRERLAVKPQERVPKKPRSAMNNKEMREADLAKAYGSLVNLKSTKLLSDSNGRKLYEVKVSADFSRKWSPGMGRSWPEVGGFELKEKSEVTGRPQDDGYILIDAREQTAARIAAQPKPEAPRPAPAVDQDSPQGRAAARDAGVPASLIAARDAATVRSQAASAAMQAFPAGPMGLTPDAVKATPEWKAARIEMDRAMTALRNANAAVVKARKAKPAAPAPQAQAPEQPKPQAAATQGVDESAVRTAYNAAMTAKTGQDYDWGKGDFGDMIVGALNRDQAVVERARNLLTNGNNETGLKVFFQQAGMKMPRTQREQKAAFDAYIGVSKEDRAASDKAKAAAKAAEKDLSIANRQARQPIPDFKDYEEARRWHDVRVRSFPSKGAYHATSEYADYVEKVRPLHAVARDAFVSTRNDAMEKAGIKVGDRVQSNYMGAMLTNQTFTGTVVMRGGDPWVKLDDKMTVSKNRRISEVGSVRWTANWTKLEAAKPTPNEKAKAEVRAKKEAKSAKPAYPAPVEAKAGALDGAMWDAMTERERDFLFYEPSWRTPSGRNVTEKAKGYLRLSWNRLSPAVQSKLVAAYELREVAHGRRSAAAPVEAAQAVKLNKMKRTTEGVAGKRVRDSRGEGIVLNANALDDSFNVRWVTGDYAGEEQRVTLGDAADVEVLNPTAKYDPDAMKKLRKQWAKEDAAKAAAATEAEKARVAGEVRGIEARARIAKPLLDRATSGTPEQQELAQSYLDGDITLTEFKAAMDSKPAAQAASEPVLESVEDDQLVDAAKRFFGTTRDPKEAGYILPSGDMLDFSGRHYSDNHPSLRGQRSVDHRELLGENSKGESLDDLFNLSSGSGSDYMQEFMGRTGAMRVDFASGIASVMGEPTQDQIRVLAQNIRGDYAALSVVDPKSGRIIDETEIDGPTPMNVRRFFDKARGKTAAPNAPLFSMETLADTDLTPAERASFNRQREYGFRGSDGVGMSDAEKSAIQVLDREESRANGIEDADKLGLRTAVNRAIGSPFGMPPITAVYLRGVAGLDGIVKPGYIQRLKDQQKRRTGTKTAGLYLSEKDTVDGRPRFVLFTDTIRTPKMAAFTAAHEVAGHYGLRSLLGDRLNRVLEQAGQNPTVRAIADSMTAQRNLTPQQRYLAIEEALSDLAAAVRTGNYQRIKDKHGVEVPKVMQSRVRSMLDNLIQRIRELFRRKDVRFSDGQVRQLLEASWKAAQGQSATMSVMGANGALEQVVFHGTPHTVDKFSMQKIGTGEGAQAFGWGIYFASQKEIAESYRKNLSHKIDSLNIDWQNLRPAGKATVAHRLVDMMGKVKYFDADDLASTGLVQQLGDYGRLVDMQPGDEVSLRELMDGMESLRISTTDGMDVYLFDDGSAIADDGEAYNAIALNAGNLYRVEVPEDADLLDWDKPLSEQPKSVREALPNVLDAVINNEPDYKTASRLTRELTMEELAEESGEALYRRLSGLLGSPEAASAAMNDAGIPGLRYADGNSRNKDGGWTHNYVIWDESAIGTPSSALESVDNDGMADDDYRGEHSAPTKDSGAPGHDVTGGGNFYPDDVYGPNGLRYYGTGEPAMDAEAYGHIQRLKNHPNYQITVYRAVPKSVKGGIKAGDWVTTVRRYALDHGRGALNGDYKIQSKIVRANEIFTNGDSWLEWGYDPQPFDEEAQRQLRERRAAKQSQNEPLESTEDQTHSEAFRKWFGQSVVTENGKAGGTPMILYHGSHEAWEVMRSADEVVAKFDAEITPYKSSAWSSEESFNQSRDAIVRGAGAVWLTDDEGVAEGYADQRDGDRVTRPFYVSMRNPLDFRDFDTIEVNEVLSEAFGRPVEISTEYGWSKGVAQAIVRDNTRVIAYAREKGYDGIIYPDTDVRGRGVHTSYVALSPGQIKSATANNGNFNPDNPSILESVEGDMFAVDTPETITAADLKIPGQIAVKREGWKGWLNAAGKKLTDLKPAALALVPLNHLADFAAKGMTAVQQYVDQHYAMQAYRNGLYRDYDAIAQDWLKYASGRGIKGLLGKVVSKQGKDLSDLMHDSTIAGVDPTKDEADYRKDPGKADAYRKLRARYDAMPEHGKDLFNRVRDSYKRQSEMLEQVIEDNLKRAMEINRAQAERTYEARVQEISESGASDDEKARLKANAANAHDDKVKDADQRVNAKMLALRKTFESMRVEAPYFPLKRYGKYWVTVLENGTMKGFSKFETAEEQDAFVKEMEAEGFQTRKKYESADNKTHEMIDPAFIAEIEGILDGAQMPDSVKDDIWQAYLERMPDMSLRKSFIHRQKVQGYHPDALRAFSSTAFHGSYQLARLKFGMEMAETLDIAEKQAARVAPVQGEQLVGELRKRHDFIMNPTGGALAQGVTTAAFIYYLGANPAHLLLNATQTIMLGVPMLGSRHGFGRTVKALQKAMTDFAQGKGHMENANLSDDEKRAFQSFLDSGLIDKTQAHDLAGVGETGVEYNAVRQKVMNKIGWFFHQSERFNREVTAMAAYRLARNEGRGHDLAVAQAMRSTYDIHFDYSAAARARVMQGDTAKALLVFRNYNVNLLYRLFRDIHQSLRGESVQVRREARKQLGGMMGMYGLFAGVAGMPFYGLAMALAGAFEDDDDPETAEQQFVRGTVELLGPDVARVLLRGVPGATFNVDLTDRIGMPNLWFRSPDRELEGRDAYYYWMEQLLGAGVGVAKQGYDGSSLVFDGLQEANAGHVARGFEKMLPAALKNVFKSVRYGADGVTTLDGEKILDLGAGGLVAQGLGYTPLDLAEQYDANRDLKNANAKLERRRRALLDRFFLAAQHGDPTDRAMTDIQAFNARNPDYAITRQTMSRSSKLRQRNSLLNENGIVMTRRMRRLQDRTNTEETK